MIMCTLSSHRPGPDRREGTTASHGPLLRATPLIPTRSAGPRLHLFLSSPFSRRGRSVELLLDELLHQPFLAWWLIRRDASLI